MSIAVTIVAVPLCMALITVFVSGTSEKKAAQEGFRKASGIFLAISMMGLLLCLFAVKHGATEDDLKTLDIPWIINGIVNSHVESEIADTESLNDCILIYYKFRCSDCRDTYSELQDWLKQHPADAEIYYIASNSELGQELLHKFPTQSVPSMIYIHPNGETFLAQSIYLETDDKSVLDTDALEKIYEYRRKVIA